MGQDPSEVQQEIEDTRSRMADTVDAIGHKTDVKGRVRGYVSDKKDALTGTVSGAAPDTETVREKGRQAAGLAQENPIGLAVAGAAAGFLVGLAIPSTRAEDERIGSVADDLKERARDTGEQALESGKQVAHDVKESAMETARESAGEQSEELSSTLHENAEHVASDAERKTY